MAYSPPVKLKVEGIVEPVFLITERSYIPCDPYDRYYGSR